MDYIKVTACYFSPTDTSRKTAQAIAAGICESYENLDLTLPAGRETRHEFLPDEVLVLAGPVYGGLIPLVMEQAIKNLHGNCTPVVLAAVYGNRDYDDALIQMRDLLSAQGFIPVAAGAFLGEHSFGNVIAAGRPDEIDLQNCKSFGRGVYNLVKNSSIGAFSLQVSGNYPYKARGPAGGFLHTVTDACIHCMNCAKVCPTACIDFEDPSKKDAEKCIKCQACAKKCPKNCRIVPDQMIEKTVERLKEMCGPGRKEPILFFGK